MRAPRDRALAVERATSCLLMGALRPIGNLDRIGGWQSRSGPTARDVACQDGAGRLRNQSRTASDPSLALIGSAARLPSGLDVRLKALDQVWLVGKTSRLSPRVSTPDPCTSRCELSCAACPKIWPRSWARTWSWRGGWLTKTLSWRTRMLRPHDGEPPGCPLCVKRQPRRLTRLVVTTLHSVSFARSGG